MPNDRPSTPTSPVACTLSPSALATRREDLAGLAARALKRAVRIDGGVRLWFAADAASAVDAAVALERECCGFLEFAVEHGVEVVVTVRGPAAAAVLEGFVALVARG
jgi:hypothetical protein